MTLEQKISILEKEVKRLKRRTLQTWVKVSVIKELTGWNFRKMEKAREQGLVKYRKNGKGIEYLLESVPEVFIKKVV